MRWIALCLIVAVASPAAAETFDLAGHTVTIETPADFCLLDRDHPVDQYIFAVTEDINTSARYLLHAAPCESLDAWRNGFAPSLRRYLNAVTPLFDGVVRSPGVSRSEFLQEMKRTFPETDREAVLAELERMYEGQPISPMGIQVLGIIGEDENAIYIAMTATFETDLGENAAATVWAITLLNSIPIFVYLVGDIAPGVHEQLAAELAPYMAELVQRNP